MPRLEEGQDWKDSFEAGEAVSIDFITSLVKHVKKDARKSKGINSMLASYAGAVSGIASSLLYHGHRGLERMLLEAGQPLEAADHMIEVIFAKFFEGLANDKVPVEAKFFIGRKK